MRMGFGCCWEGFEVKGFLFCTMLGGCCCCFFLLLLFLLVACLFPLLVSRGCVPYLDGLRSAAASATTATRVWK
jgi:hypothetical protein